MITNSSIIVSLIILSSCFKGTNNDKADYRKKAVIAEQNEQYDIALENYNKAIELDNKNESYYYERSHLKLKMKNINGAISDMTYYIKYEQDSDFYDFKYEARAELYIKAKDYLNAIEDLTKSIDFEPDYSNHNMRAYSNLCLNDWKSAIADCNKALYLKSMDESYYPFGDAFFHKAVAYYHLENISEACFNYKIWQTKLDNDFYIFKEDYYIEIFKKLCK